MQQAFTVFADIGQKFNDVLQIPLRLHRFRYVVPARFELVLSRSVLYDLALLHRLDQPVIDAQSHAVLVCDLCEDRLFIRRRRILADRPCTAVTVSHEIMVRIEPDRARRDAGKKVLCADALRLLHCHALFCLLLSHP